MELSIDSILALVGVIVVGVALLVVFATVNKGASLDKEKYRADWLEIENNIKKNNIATYQFAILSADKLLDRALMQSGVKGNTMGERLKNCGKSINNIDSVWAAHKIRNKIAHEVSVDLSVRVAERMLSVYKKALKDVGAI